MVKQTVMTSVYGVTYVGAREQIKRRLEEKGLITDDRALFGASCYAAKVINYLPSGTYYTVLQETKKKSKNTINALYFFFVSVLSG